MIEKRQIKKNVKSEDGRVLVVINACYPYYCDGEEKVEKNKESNMSKRFNDYYEKLIGAFVSYGEKTLKKDAASVCSDAAFKPFGCVMNCIVSYDDENYVSVVADVTVFSFGKTRKKRVAQNWDKSRGVLCPMSTLIGKIAKKEIINLLYKDAETRMEKKVNSFYSDYKKRVKKFFDEGAFCITPVGYGFIYPSGALNDKNEPITLTVSKEYFHP